MKLILSLLRILAKEIYNFNRGIDSNSAVKTAQNFVLKIVISQLLNNKNISADSIVSELDKQIQLVIPESLSRTVQENIEKNLKYISYDSINDIYEIYQAYNLSLDLQTGDFEYAIDKSERRNKGIYYTPKPIVKHIVDNTLGKYLWGQQGENSKTPDEIKDLTILDPACGCGLFLSYIFDVLVKYYSYYLPDGIDSWLPLILKRHIYGMDLDDNAINIARIILTLKSLMICDLQSYPIHINQGNFLTQQQEYKDGFTMIVGNPPHGAKIPIKERKLIQSNFETYGSRDSSAFFIKKSVNLLKDNGTLGFVVPKTLSYVVSWQPIREFLLDRCRIEEIVDIKNAFDDVRLEQLIIFARKRPDKFISDYQIRITHYYLENTKTNTTESTNLTPQRFSIWLNDKRTRKLIDKILGNSVLMGEITEIWDGISIWKFPSFSYEPDSEYNQPCLMGKNIKKYGLKQNIRYIKNTLDQKKIELFYRPKIVAQDIVAYIKYPKPHIKIMATIDKLGKFLSFNTVTNIYSCHYPMEYLCAIINSRLISWYAHNYIFNRAIRTMHFRTGYADHIPIYRLDSGNSLTGSICEQIISLTDKILYLNEQLNVDKNVIIETEKKIEELIFELYGITDEEVRYLQYYAELY